MRIWPGHTQGKAVATRVGTRISNQDRGALKQRHEADITAGPELLYPATSFDLERGPSREECWEHHLGPRLRASILERSGDVLGWSATLVDTATGKRASATVFGRDALVVAEPTVRFADNEYTPAYRMIRYSFPTSGLLYTEVSHRPSRLRGWTTRRRRDDSPPPKPTAPAGTAEDVGEVIASMPARARELLTEPFDATGERVLRSHRFWQGHDPSFLRPVLVVLASTNRATMAYGQRVIPAGHDSSRAHWALECWHSEVTHRVGA